MISFQRPLSTFRASSTPEAAMSGVMPGYKLFCWYPTFWSVLLIRVHYPIIRRRARRESPLSKPRKELRWISSHFRAMLRRHRKVQLSRVPSLTVLSPISLGLAGRDGTQRSDGHEVRRSRCVNARNSRRRTRSCTSAKACSSSPRGGMEDDPPTAAESNAVSMTTQWKCIDRGWNRHWMAVAMSNDEVLDLDRQLAEPYTGRVVDGVRDGCRHSRQPDLADAARSKLVQVRVGEFHEMDVQRWYVGVCRDDIVGEIGIDRGAVTRIV